jgi:hypothetical protein
MILVGAPFLPSGSGFLEMMDEQPHETRT